MRYLSPLVRRQPARRDSSTSLLDRGVPGGPAGAEASRELVLTDPLLVLRVTDDTPRAPVRPEAMDTPAGEISGYGLSTILVVRSHRAISIAPHRQARAPPRVRRAPHNATSGSFAGRLSLRRCLPDVPTAGA